MLIQEDYFKNIFNTVREGILILDENLRVLSANRSFFNIFKVDTANTIGSLLYDLGNGQWNIPHLRVLLEDILLKNDTVDDYEIEHNFESIGKKTMLLNACKVREKKNDLPIILLTIEDITERKRLVDLLAEDELKKYQEHLEEIIKERTAELTAANKQLYQEINERKRVEENLVQRSRTLDSFFKYTITPLAILDRHFNFIRVNEAYAAAGQRDVLEFIGHNHFEFYPSDARTIFEQVVETKEPYQTFARPFSYPDHPEWGMTYWDWTLTPILSDTGEVEFLVFSLKDVTERKRAEKALIETEARYRGLFEDSPISLWDEDFSSVKQHINDLRASGVSDFRAYFEEHPEEVVRCINATKIIDVNQTTLNLFKADSKESLLERLNVIFSKESVDVFKEELITFTGGDTQFQSEAVLKNLADDKLYTIVRLSIAPGYEDTWGKVFVSVSDITERKWVEEEKKKLEAQLLHAQKMEALGTLAGGIAHDFNNILNVIIGYGTMVLDRLEAGCLSKEQMNEVLTAAERAANLTRQLLVFSRKQAVDVKPLNVNELIIGIQKMLVRVIRENIELNLDLADRLLIVMADTGQIEQVLTNLATNAKDAMPEGGHLTIVTGLQELDDEYVAAYGYGKPGMYALITVADTGHGMDAETRNKIFEPFFTTKGVGEGTGLGLAISYGIIKQHSGYIKVYSEPGQGAEFRIYLPLVEETAELDKKTEAAVSAKGGNEMILVAEDDPSLRDLSRIVLESFGYSVITAEDGEDAITKFMENRDKIQLVILDMIMPKKSGKDAYEEIRKTSPGVKALLMSGYTIDIIKTSELTEAGFDFIYKPFVPQDFLKKVRKVLDR